MIFRHHKPAPPLADFVDVVWFYECYDTPYRREWILPSGDMGIVIDLRESASGAILCELGETRDSILKYNFQRKLTARLPWPTPTSA